MKDLRIYSVDEIQEPLVLSLTCNGGGGVALVAVNGDGVELSGGRLITLTANGSVCLHHAVSKHLELPLDKDGRLKIAGRKEDVVTFSDDDLANLCLIIDVLEVRASSGSSLDRENLAYEGLDVLQRMIEALNLPISKLRKS